MSFFFSQGVENLPREHLERLAISFGILPSSDEYNFDNIERSEFEQEATAALDNAVYLPQENSIVSLEEVTNNVSSLESEHIVDSGVERAAGADDSDEVKSSITSFCEFVGVDSATARGYLEVTSALTAISIVTL